MSSVPSQQIPGQTSTTTGRLTLMVNRTLANAPSAKSAVLGVLRDDPAGGHYSEMRYGQAAWDSSISHDDEERPRE